MRRIKRVCPTQAGARVSFDIVWDTSHDPMPCMDDVTDVIWRALQPLTVKLDGLGGLLEDDALEEIRGSLQVIPLEITEYYYPDLEEGDDNEA